MYSLKKIEELTIEHMQLWFCLIGIVNDESKSRIDFKFEVLNLTIRAPECLPLCICIYLTGFPLFLNFHYFHYIITR